MKSSARFAGCLRPLRAPHARFPALSALCLSIAACGAAPSPAPIAAPSPSGVPSAAPAPSAASSADPKAAELCLATAQVKRAKFSGEPPKITVKHVLVKFGGAKNAGADVKRTKEQACLRALEARDKVRNGADFAAIVGEYSDEAGAASREGSIGTVERKDLAKPFADAAFELGANQLSDVVETEFGFHLILRTE